MPINIGTKYFKLRPLLEGREFLGGSGMPTLSESRAKQMLDQRAKQGSPRIILASDVDGTLKTVFSEQVIGPEELYSELTEMSIPVSYVTGNSIDVMMNRIDQGNLPSAPIVVSAVGTDIWFMEASGENYIRDEVYSSMLDERYHRRTVVEEGLKLVEAFKDRLWETGDSKTAFELTLQKVEEERRFLLDDSVPTGQEHKVSFNFFATSDAMIREVEKAVNAIFPLQRIVICEELHYNSKLASGDNRRKYNLDVIPVTKAEAVKYISSVLKVDYTVVAGDSGNDLEMLTETGDVAVIVGNARPELHGAIRARFSGWGNGLFHRLTEHGKPKLYIDDTGTGRVGPESIAYAMRLFNRVLRAQKV